LNKEKHILAVLLGDGGSMDRNEMIALGIVALAALLLIRHYRKRKGSCCGSDCLPGHKPALKKKGDLPE
jgi:hypothetical protein